ncbi:MAG TPA: sulfur oxidation c-type cytochrome SoxA [Burkholderiales bacterium]|nr:sulfur oxidation c-type cytochrome SoxA [Burkholderiales bacterium]
MRKLLLALVGLGMLAGSTLALASPEDDRRALIELFEKRFPEVKFNDYIYGALAFSADAKAQYDSIMEFPPFLEVLDQGKKMWNTPFKNGKTYASCFPNGGRDVAGNYPYYDEKLGKVVTFEMKLNMCRVANGEQPYGYGDMKTMGVLESYARTLSDGMRVDIKVSSPGARAAYERGKEFFYTRHGQLNFACASCHVDSAGKVLRTEILSPVIGQATHWPVFRAATNLVTLQKRYAGCLKNVRAVPPKPGSVEFNDLEYFHTYLSNGLVMHSSVFRK